MLPDGVAFGRANQARGTSAAKGHCTRRRIDLDYIISVASVFFFVSCCLCDIGRYDCQTFRYNAVDQHVGSMRLISGGWRGSIANPGGAVEYNEGERHKEFCRSDIMKYPTRQEQLTSCGVFDAFGRVASLPR